MFVFPIPRCPTPSWARIQHRERQHDEALTTWRTALLKTDGSEAAGAAEEQHRVRRAGPGHAEESARGRSPVGRSHQRAPRAGAVAGARGAVLLRLGRAAEALPLDAGRTERDGQPQPGLHQGADGRRAGGAGARRGGAARLAEARLAEPDCELLPRAEADLAAGPLAAPAGGRAGRTVAAAGRRPTPRSLMLRHWRRDARILAFVTGFVVLEHLGLRMAPTVIVIVMSIAPEPSGAVAPARTVCGGGAVRARAGSGGALWDDVAFGGRPLALAVGVAACWLVARRRRLERPGRRRGRRWCSAGSWRAWRSCRCSPTRSGSRGSDRRWRSRPRADHLGRDPGADRAGRAAGVAPASRGAACWPPCPSRSRSWP